MEDDDSVVYKLRGVYTVYHGIRERVKEEMDGCIGSGK
jgi:hypothetical protein